MTKIKITVNFNLPMNNWKLTTLLTTLEAADKNVSLYRGGQFGCWQETAINYFNRQLIVIKTIKRWTQWTALLICSLFPSILVEWLNHDILLFRILSTTVSVYLWFNTFLNLSLLDTPSIVVYVLANTSQWLATSFHLLSGDTNILSNDPAH